MRTIAQSHKNLFSKIKRENLPEPSIKLDIKEDVKKLNNKFSDYIWENEYLAMNIEEYTEADEQSEQMKLLDRVTNNKENIFLYRLDITIVTASIDEKIAQFK
jgi:hypothetical protein